MDSIRVRAVFYLGVCLSVFSVDCQKQMSPDNRLSSQDEQFPLVYVTRNLVCQIYSFTYFSVLFEDFRIKLFVSTQTNPELVQVFIYVVPSTDV